MSKNTPNVADKINAKSQWCKTILEYVFTIQVSLTISLWMEKYFFKQKGLAFEHFIAIFVMRSTPGVTFLHFFSFAILETNLEKPPAESYLV